MGKIIRSEELYKKMKREEDFVLIDVRNEKSHLRGHLPKDRNIRLENLIDLELDKEREIVVYCSIGYLSTLAQKKLEKRGFKNVKNYKGGVEEWKSMEYPIEGEDSI